VPFGAPLQGKTQQLYPGLGQGGFKGVDPADALGATQVLDALGQLERDPSWPTEHVVLRDGTRRRISYSSRVASSERSATNRVERSNGVALRAPH